MRGTFFSFVLSPFNFYGLGGGDKIIPVALELRGGAFNMHTRESGAGTC